MNPRKSMLLIACLAMAACATAKSGPDIADRLREASLGSHRSGKNVARNVYRHPVETLTFFGLEEDMTVLEVLPGGMWYSEVIAPVLRERGRFLVAGIDPSQPDLPDYQIKGHQRLEARLAAEADVFGEVELVKLSPPDAIDLGPAGSVDMVLTFRNMHGWVRAGVAETVLAAFYEVLKPGGVLGVVQHRAGPRSNPDPDAFIGYLAEDRVIGLVEGAGFVLEARSEINANPRDSADWEKGVWTLPPTLMLGDQDREKYIAIGESDRMTLRFRKPAS